MNIFSISDTNLEDSSKLYKNLKLNLESFYELNISIEKKIQKLKMMDLYSQYTRKIITGDIQLIKNISEGIEWNGYQVIYIPEEVSTIYIDVSQQTNNKNILITGFGTLKEYKASTSKSLHRIILACNIKNNADFQQSFFIQKELEDCIIYTRVYDKQHNLRKPYTIANLEGTFGYNKALKRVVILDGNYIDLQNMNDTFLKCEQLEEVYLENINISNPYLRNMCGTFQDCTITKSIDISNINTAGVTDFCNLFSGCKSLKYIKGLDTITIAPHARLDRVFADCASLERIDVKSWDILKKPHFHIFDECNKLKHTGSLILDIKLRRNKGSKWKC